MKTLLLHGVLHCMGHDHETDHGEGAERVAVLLQAFPQRGPLP